MDQPLLDQNFTSNSNRPVPKTWLLESILATILCCLPFGIAGIVNAAKVESRYFDGDADGAERASAAARKWAIVSYWSGLGFIVLYFLVKAYLTLST